MSLWVDYISFLKAKQSNSILNTVFGRALSLHPKVENFWLQAAMHELEVNCNAHAARVILQRAIRVNKSSKTVWLRYFELELWNALRVVERQRASGLEVTSEVVEEGAPLVVFRHALDALSGRVEDVLELHAACEGVAPALSESLEEELKARCGVDPKLWEHLVRVHVDRALRPQADVQQGDQTAHLEKATVEQAVELVTAAVTACIGLLTESAVSMAQFTDEEDRPLPLSAEHLAMGMRAISSTLMRCGQVAAYALSPVKSGSNSDSRPAKKAKRSSAQVPAAEEPDEGVEGVVALEDALHSGVTVSDRTRKTLVALKAPVVAVLRQLVEFSDLVAAQQDLALRTALTFQLHAVRHQAWLLASLVHLPASVLGDEGALSVDSLADIVAQSGPAVARLAAVGAASKAEVAAATSSWATTVALLSRSLSAERLEDLSEQLVDSAPLLASCDEGERFLMGLVLAVRSSTGERVLRSVVAGPLDSASRGQWCTAYLRFALSSSGDLCALRAAFKWLMDCMHSRPHLFAGANLEGVFALLVDAELAAVGVSIGSFGTDSGDGDHSEESQRAAFLSVRDAAEKAVGMCAGGAAAPFWEVLEGVERRLGHHAAANHIAWKKGRSNL